MRPRCKNQNRTDEQKKNGPAGSSWDQSTEYLWRSLWWKRLEEEVCFKSRVKMEKVCAWCCLPSDWGRLKNSTEQNVMLHTTTHPSSDYRQSAGPLSLYTRSAAALAAARVMPSQHLARVPFRQFVLAASQSLQLTTAPSVHIMRKSNQTPCVYKNQEKGSHPILVIMRCYRSWSLCTGIQPARDF